MASFRAAVLTAFCLALLLVPAAAAAGGPPRPDLTVERGAVRLADGRLRGWAVVRNAGARRSGRFALVLLARRPGRDPVLLRRGARGLRPGAARRLTLRAALPARLAGRRLRLVACVDPVGPAGKRRAGEDCRRVGTVRPSAAVPGPPGSEAASSFPTDPIPFSPGVVFSLDDALSRYWVYVPASYDPSHATPAKLFVWLHGCGGESAWDIGNVSPGGAQDWISVAPGGAEGGCWEPAADQAIVLAAIADLETHFNVDRRRVVLGGYSSGGDLAYRLGFEHAAEFAGVLAENTSPFRDTGLSQSQALAAASWKFHVVHLAHLQDTTYPIATVREETAAMSAAGFPLQLVERAGTHYDEPGAMVGGEAVPGTEADVRTYLLPHLEDGWLAP